MMIVSVQCTKEGPNATSVAASRALLKGDPDSTVYSPFYDSTLVPKADVVPSANDYAITTGVFTIIKTYCASTACHGGGIKPNLLDYASIRAMVEPGNPEGSKLFQMITTNDFNRAMPPVNYGIDLSVTEKIKIYNWIRNGAKENPDLADFRPAAVQLIAGGCGSGNCHNQATVGGEWARANLISIAPTDTFTFTYRNPNTGSVTLYAQLKEPKLTQVWNAYKDSVRKFYTDTVANASFRPYKTFGSPVQLASRRGPLNSYDDILLDIYYPKGVRSVSGSTPVYTNPVTGQRYWVRSDHYNMASTMLSRVDSTMVVANPRTGVYNANHHGDMAYGDGGLKPGEIAVIKAWYFLDPNIPDTWKYGLTGAGIFKYRKSGNIITK
jgi:hypothetical protein